MTMTPRLKMKEAAASVVSFDDLRDESSTKATRDAVPNAVDNATIIKSHRHLSLLVSPDGIATTAEAASFAGSTPPLRNPLNDPTLLRNHVAALRLEADLYPLRLILSRLMTHPTHNRKGIFNQPVDPFALGLPDYHQIVKHPMDLGTVKRNLHAVAYCSRKEAIQDIRLVFVNAILYNPPLNPVHISARELLTFFDSCCQNLHPSVSDVTASMVDSKIHPEGVTIVSSTAEPSSSKSDAVLGQSITNSCNSSYFLIDAAGLSRVVGSSMKTAIYNRNTTSGFGSAQAGSLGTMQPKSSRRFPQRRASFLKEGHRHVCEQCYGRTCLICVQGCLQHEPALLVCCGAQCAGSKIRKGAVYYTTTDGIHQVCDRCVVALPTTIPPHMQSDSCRYKQDLLKRRNDEEIVEKWITCRGCAGGVHVICALHNDYVHDKLQYLCPRCRSSGEGYIRFKSAVDHVTPADDDEYSFVSGLNEPVPLRTLRDVDKQVLDSVSLNECAISKFVQEKVKDVMSCSVNAGKTVTVRVISDCDHHFPVPGPVRRYFRMADGSTSDPVLPPKFVQYRQKAIVVFQKIDGLDVCVFCMYVHEYDADDSDNKRVYIAYIDSVEHFRPRELRTQVFHEILVAYLATARERGFAKAHIWACPPSRGNCFIFWNHPVSQRVPTAERLQRWYHSALSRGIDLGVVVDVKSLYESDFERQLTELYQDDKDRMLCPPLIDGDFWIEEAVRLHQSATDRILNVRSPAEVCVWNVGSGSRNLNPCPALQVACLLRDRIMTHPLSVPFRHPVNAAALKLKDYHKVIKEPMDLGTIYSRCILGEYNELRDVARDVILMVTNAKKFNPPGHVVHSMATDVLNLFNSELNSLTKTWSESFDGNSCQAHDTMSMSLDTVLESNAPETSSEDTMDHPVVVIEDDRSTDGSRSMSSSVVSETSSNLEVATFAFDDTKKTTENRQHRKDDMVNLKVLDLHSDGPEAVMQRMVGKDVWLLNKRDASPPKPFKKQNNKRRCLDSSRGQSEGEPPSKKRRQIWLCEEVGFSVRRMRTSFFSCILLPKVELSEIEAHKLHVYRDYVASFDSGVYIPGPSKSSIADTRSALLELSQFRNFEFDTLRRAKYSTNMLLYHIHHSNAPGGVPSCTFCGETIINVRWHKTKRNNGIKTSYIPSNQKETSCPSENTSSCTSREDLCVACYKSRQSEEDFIPIPVSSTS